MNKYKLSRAGSQSFKRISYLTNKRSAEFDCTLSVKFIELLNIDKKSKENR